MQVTVHDGGIVIHRLTAVVLNEHHFPIVENSQLDVAFLRMANQALQRKQNGIVDSFLFVVCGNIGDATEQTTLFPLPLKDQANLDKYGFPEIDIISVETMDENGDQIDYSDVEENIGDEISKWLKEKHPTAITAFTSNGDDGIDVWWSGIEAISDEIELPFDLEIFSKTLPDSQRFKAATWLAILKKSCAYACDENWVSDNQFRINSIALSEWLHGFEAASGNGYNNFDAGEAGNAVELDDFYLGCTWGQENPKDCIAEAYEECESDVDDMKTFIISSISSGLRNECRDLFVEYFGSELGLFWALYTSIWPKFNKPVADALQDVAGLRENDFEDVAEPWMFVTDGWTDSADS